jgi:hypothetical protein
MQCILCKIYFWNVFHKYYNFICAPICTKVLFLQKVGVTVSLLAIFSNFNYFLLCCTILILSWTQEHFHLAEGVSEEMANIVFNKAARKVIKGAVKHARHVSTALYY